MDFLGFPKNPNRFHVYVLFLVNVSQIWAMYCLVLFYHACAKELKPFNPLPKFICIKAVVFFSFWQECAIGAAVHFKIIKGTVNPFSVYTPDEVATGIQDFLICVEMFIAAIAHHFAFHYRDFSARDAQDKNVPFLTAFVQTSVPKDVIEDVRNTDLTEGLPKLPELKVPKLKVPKLPISFKPGRSTEETPRGEGQHSDNVSK